MRQRPLPATQYTLERAEYRALGNGQGLVLTLGDAIIQLIVEHEAGRAPHARAARNGAAPAVVAQLRRQLQPITHTRDARGRRVFAPELRARAAQLAGRGGRGRAAAVAKALRVTDSHVARWRREARAQARAAARAKGSA